MFGKKSPPPPKPALPVTVLTQDYVIAGNLRDTIADGLLRPWLLKIGNPTADGVAMAAQLEQARLRPILPGAAGDRTAPLLDLWLLNMLVIIPGDAAGQQMVVEWAKTTSRKTELAGTYYVGPFVIQGKALKKDLDPPRNLGYVVPIVDASIVCSTLGSQLAPIRAPAVVIGTGWLHAFEVA